MKINHKTKLFTSLLIVSYLLNFVWESFHTVWLYEGHSFTAERFVPMISYVSFIDGLLIIGAYLIVSILFKDLSWINKIKSKHIKTFSVVSIIFAIIIEYKGVYLLKQWSYSNLMPTIFGIGLSPLIQLAVIGIIAIYTTKRLIV